LNFLTEEDEETQDQSQKEEIDSATKKFIEDRIKAFDDIQKQLTQVQDMLKIAKEDTIEKYKIKPNKAILYPTDLIKDYFKDIIKVLKS
jgi:ribosome-associated translation inhibitor RaiA